jgi:hypothetical protein
MSFKCVSSAGEGLNGDISEILTVAANGPIRRNQRFEPSLGTILLIHGRAVVVRHTAMGATLFRREVQSLEGNQSFPFQPEFS